MTNTSLRNLMFDLGGVIMDIRRDNAVKALQEIGMADADQMLGVYGQKGIFLQLEKGLITVDQFHNEIRRHFPSSVTTDQIDHAFCQFLIGIPVDRLHQLEQLSARGYNIYLLSNTNKLMWDYFILNEFCKDGKSIDHYFDGVITSFDAHAYKPDAEIFIKAAQKFSIKPEETLFYDDSAANVEASQALGFRGAHVVDTNRPFADYIDKL